MDEQELVSKLSEYVEWYGNRWAITDELLPIETQPELVQLSLKMLEKLVRPGNRLEPICAKAEPLIIEINKDHLVELYDFAYEQAVKTDKVNELKDIDAKLNGC